MRKETSIHLSLVHESHGKDRTVPLRLETTLADNELDLHNSDVGPTKPGSAPMSGNLGRSEHERAPSNTVPPVSGAGKKGTSISTFQITRHQTSTLPRDARGVPKRVSYPYKGWTTCSARDSGVDYLVTDFSVIL
ncbi:hypothetical protein GQ600_3418 [Phytophthora cactorum]|nr:hypothetical protein GQ600_3418 [Phytophthora cactorum]